MNVQLQKTRSKGVDDGMFPVGYKVSGLLVDEHGDNIDDPLNITKAGVFLRTSNTAFGDFPYQFATDTVLTVRLVQPGKYSIETVSTVWSLVFI